MHRVYENKIPAIFKFFCIFSPSSSIKNKLFLAKKIIKTWINYLLINHMHPKSDIFPLDQEKISLKGSNMRGA
jgi:hypothetical protein